MQMSSGLSFSCCTLALVNGMRARREQLYDVRTAIPTCNCLQAGKLRPQCPVGALPRRCEARRQGYMAPSCVRPQLGGGGAWIGGPLL